MMLRLPGVTGDAVTSADGRYRFRVTREWDTSKPHVVWVMLHASTSDADRDDRTLRKVQLFTRSWGWGGLVVVNLFAAIVRDKRDLSQHPAPIGATNNEHILAAVTDQRTHGVVAGWGNYGSVFNRGDFVEGLLRGALRRPLYRMPGPLTSNDQPPHPMRYPNGSVAIPWRRDGARV